MTSTNCTLFELVVIVIADAKGRIQAQEEASNEWQLSWQVRCVAKSNAWKGRLFPYLSEYGNFQAYLHKILYFAMGLRTTPVRPFLLVEGKMVYVNNFI